MWLSIVRRALQAQRAQLLAGWYRWVGLLACCGGSLVAHGQNNYNIYPATGTYSAVVGETRTYTYSGGQSGSWQSYSWVVDNAGGQVVFNNTSPAPRSADIVWNAPGTWRIRYQVPATCYSCNPVEDGSLTVTVTCPNTPGLTQSNPVDLGPLSTCGESRSAGVNVGPCNAAYYQTGRRAAYYRFSLGIPSQVAASTCYSSSYDTYMFLAKASDINSPIAYNDNAPAPVSGCSATASFLTQKLDAGTYYLVVSSSTQDAGSAYLSLTTTPLPPTIALVNPPAGGYRQVLGETGLSISVAGADTYSWSPATGLSATTGSTVVATPPQTTTYTVTGTRCGLASQPLQVQVQVVPGNYITTRVAQVAGKLTSGDLVGQPPADVAVSTVYYDGLGRPTQKVAWAGSTTQRDLVQPITYDAVGRVATAYLPYAQDVNSGSFKPNAVAQQAAYYQPGSTLARIAQDTKPLAVTLYEASPLNRVLEQGAAGAAWQVGTSHTKKINQRANTSAEAVRQWNYDPASQSFNSPGVYAAGQLMTTETRDEQDNLVTEYTDKQGQTVLKRVSLTQAVCGVKGYSSGGDLVLTAPAGMKITGVLSAKFGAGTGSDGACENFVFGPCAADVTALVRTAVASQLATTPTSLSVRINTDYLGDPCYGQVKSLEVVAACIPTTASTMELLTYYAYDDLNNLRLVISPEGVNKLLSANSWALSADFMRSWCFRYSYDGRHRVISRQTPGTDPLALVYNQRDQVALTQDGNQAQAAAGEWAFTKYDGLGRPIMTGVVTLAGQTQASLQATLNGQAICAETTDNTSSLGYTLTASSVPVAATDVLTVNYYDTYAAPMLGSSQLACSLSASQWLAQPRGLATGSSVRTLLPDGSLGNWLSTATYYDKNYRVVQAVTQNQLGGVNYQLATYDFAGKTLTASTNISQGGYRSIWYKDAKRFTYYPNGLADATYQTITSMETYPNGQPEILLVKNGYNEVGQLIDKRLHSTTGGSTFLQKVDYRYNIRGWLTHVNSRDLDNSNIEQSPGLYVADNSDQGVAEPDLFGFELRYNDMLHGGATAQYNGNIAQQMWQTRSPDPNNTRNNLLRAYNYSYDPANRIKGAQFNAYISNNWTTSGPVDFSVSNITYDGNGNLLTMTRQGTTGGGNANPTKGLLDQLTYSYTAVANGQTLTGNQLQAVDDAAATPQAAHDFDDNGSKFTPGGAPEYTYDKNGNLLSDANKGITSISYTRQNQPAVITFKVNPSTGNTVNTIRYTYSAMGLKLTKQQYTGSTLVKTTDYAGPVVYETTPGTGATPVFVQTAEGRALYLPAANGSALPWKYEYHLKDHLGNLRFAFRADRDNGATTQLHAGMEPASAAREEQQFAHVAETRLADPDHARTGSYVARLNARQGRRNGPSLRLAVAAGDSIRAEVYARYDRDQASFGILQRGALVAGSLTGSPLGPLAAEQAPPAPTSATRRSRLPFLGASMALVPQLLHFRRKKLPTAYLRYELFNKDSQLVATRTQPIRRTATDEWQHLQAGTKADSAGFVRVSLVNESDVAAYFDDMAVNAVAPTPYQENHYDPFGLNLVGIEQDEVPNSAFQYNGKEKQEEYGLNWTDYGARMYDAQLGRFAGADDHAFRYPATSPYAYVFNNPLLFVDPDGRDGRVTGSGTKDDPFVVTANYYYYGLSEKQAQGLKDAVGSYNNKDQAFKLKGDVYIKFNLTAVATANETEAKEAVSKDTFTDKDGKTQSFGNKVNANGTGGKEAFADSDGINIRLDQGKVAASVAGGASEKSLLKGVFVHEIGHNLGGVHGDPGGTMRKVDETITDHQIKTGSSSDVTQSYIYPGVSKDFISTLVGRIDKPYGTDYAHDVDYLGAVEKAKKDGKESPQTTSYGTQGQIYSQKKQ